MNSASVFSFRSVAASKHLRCFLFDVDTNEDDDDIDNVDDDGDGDVDDVDDVEERGYDDRRARASIDTSAGIIEESYILTYERYITISGGEFKREGLNCRLTRTKSAPRNRSAFASSRKSSTSDLRDSSIASDQSRDLNRMFGWEDMLSV